MKTQDILNSLALTSNRSAWDKAVIAYAEELIEADVENYDEPLTVETLPRLLNGAKNWSEYSFGGCSLIYDTDIAERTCTPSFLKEKKGGELQPNSNRTWLDVQARALYQAANRIRRIIKNHERS